MQKHTKIYMAHFGYGEQELFGIYRLLDETRRAQAEGEVAVFGGDVGG